jgi:uncharacterized protein YrrD
MLRSLEHLEGYKVNAIDGEIGCVVDFFLDDESWTVRYLVVETGGLFERRQVLVSPSSFRQVEWSIRIVHLDLTRAVVERSPSVETDKPVSRQYRWEYHRRYGAPNNGSQSALGGSGDYPNLLAASRWNNEAIDGLVKPSDVHLRSAREVRGYHVLGSDKPGSVKPGSVKEVGSVGDFIVDDATWKIRYLVVDTGKWWFGRKVLVAPQWARRMSWVEGNIYLNLSRDTVRHGPEWKPNASIDRAFEIKLHHYFGSPDLG